MSHFLDKQNTVRSQQFPKLATLHNLSLTAFRSYPQCHLTIQPTPTIIVFIGPNGAGKTNLLEALSFLAPGRGLRRAKIEDVQAHNISQPWSIWAQFKEDEQYWELSTGQNPASPQRRIIKSNGTSLPSQIELASRLHVQWITPSMDRIFLEGSTQRRRFLDRLVLGWKPDHAQQLISYEKALRERLILLEKHAPPPWLDAVEHGLSTYSIAIATARRELVNRINSILQEPYGPFPPAFLRLTGELDHEILDWPSDKIEHYIQNQFRHYRPLDQARGTSLWGCHRSDLRIYDHRGIDGASCSTGEQKILLITLILAAARMTKISPRPGLLLLDEITAHLDQRHRHALFEILATFPMTTWMTGTDRHLFEHLESNMQLFQVDRAMIKPA